MRIEQELQRMGFVLPTPKPLAAYIPAVKVGHLVFTAGRGPTWTERPCSPESSGAK